MNFALMTLPTTAYDRGRPLECVHDDQQLSLGFARKSALPLSTLAAQSSIAAFGGSNVRNEGFLLVSVLY